MKKFEYKNINIRSLIEQRRAEKYPGNNISDDVIYHELLNELGADGWDLYPSNDYSFFGKKEIA